ncbi:MAG: peptidoglycan-binding protein [Bryobacterales bacterium]|nr:peptidoglycan-binding protein [Bryobacterales bacterium]
MAIVALATIDPGIPKSQPPPSTAIQTTSGGLIVGLDGGTYQPYKPTLIAKVQAALAKKGFYKGEVNGLFDKETMTALGAFQKQMDLPSAACRPPARAAFCSVISPFARRCFHVHTLFVFRRVAGIGRPATVD